MKLTPKKIPTRFIETLPEGLKYVHRNGNEFLVVEEVTCKNGHSLIADSVRIHQEPSIRLLLKFEEHEGMIFVDAFWGSHDKLYSFIPYESEKGLIPDIRCCECGCSLITDHVCDIEGCGSDKAIDLILPGGANRILVCARFGCPAHNIDIRELPHSLTDQVDAINFFGAHDDDVFQGI